MMRLLEAILDANHRALAGDENAGLHPADFEGELPIVALTCIDPRLNPLFPQVLGLPQDQFVWLRNAGNIITDPLSSTLRSLALGCAVKGAKQIAIIGHTDCLVRKTSTMELIDRFRALGVERHILPENLNEFFGVFASESQNVIKAADIVRRSPLIGPKTPVHGLLVDTFTGKLEWLVNGYQVLENGATSWSDVVQSARHTVDALKAVAEVKLAEFKFPEGKIGDLAAKAEEWLAKAGEKLAPEPARGATIKAPLVPPKIPPAPLRPSLRMRPAPK